MRILTTLALVCALALPALAQNGVHPPGGSSSTVTSSSTAVALNGSVTVTYEDGSTATHTVAIGGVETTTSNGSGILTGSFSGTINIGGCSETVNGSGRVSRGPNGTRFYSFKWEKEGVKYRVSILLGHPEGNAASATVVDPTDPNNFGYGSNFFQ